MQYFISIYSSHILIHLKFRHIILDKLYFSFALLNDEIQMTQKVAIVSREFFLIRKLMFFLFQVTGANKGIGYAIVEKLSSVFDGVIYLTGTRNLFLVVKAT
jgi:hypothetical protein